MVNISKAEVWIFDFRGFTKEKIKVACVGDSITCGDHLDDRGKHSYPAQLQVLLGENFSVENFGVGGCTLVRKGRPKNLSRLSFY